jgi:predicted flavoprotein YhiN
VQKDLEQISIFADSAALVEAVGSNCGRKELGGYFQCRVAQTCSRAYCSRIFDRGQRQLKDEFVTCRCVNLYEVKFKTMQSRVADNLFFAGEVLNIDGIMGGFNFQLSWTTGWLRVMLFPNK